MSTLEDIEKRARDIESGDGDTVAGLVADLAAHLREPVERERKMPHVPNVDVRGVGSVGSGYGVFIGGHEALYCFSQIEAQNSADGIERALGLFAEKGDPT